MISKKDSEESFFYFRNFQNLDKYIMNKISGIYSITQISTGKRYIGSSVHIRQRWTSHRSSLNRNLNFNPHLQNAWNKYGHEDFIFEILEENISSEQLENKENEYISKFEIGNRETNTFDNTKGFNSHWAGRTGCVNPLNYKSGKDHHLYGVTSLFKGKTHSEETKKRISELQIGQPGRHTMPHTEESKKKMSESKKNKPWSDARREAQNKKKQGV